MSNKENAILFLQGIISGFVHHHGYFPQETIVKHYVEKSVELADLVDKTYEKKEKDK